MINEDYYGLDNSNLSKDNKRNNNLIILNKILTFRRLKQRLCFYRKRRLQP